MVAINAKLISANTLFPFKPRNFDTAHIKCLPKDNPFIELIGINGSISRELVMMSRKEARKASNSMNPLGYAGVSAIVYFYLKGKNSFVICK